MQDLLAVAKLTKMAPQLYLGTSSQREAAVELHMLIVSNSALSALGLAVLFKLMHHMQLG